MSVSILTLVNLTGQMVKSARGDSAEEPSSSPSFAAILANGRKSLTPDAQTSPTTPIGAVTTGSALTEGDIRFNAQESVTGLPSPPQWLQQFRSALTEQLSPQQWQQLETQIQRSQNVPFPQFLAGLENWMSKLPSGEGQVLEGKLAAAAKDTVKGIVKDLKANSSDQSSVVGMLAILLHGIPPATAPTTPVVTSQEAQVSGGQEGAETSLSKQTASLRQGLAITQSDPPIKTKTSEGQNTPLTSASRWLQELTATATGTTTPGGTAQARPAMASLPRVSVAAESDSSVKAETSAGQNTPLALASRWLQELTATATGSTTQDGAEGQARLAAKSAPAVNPETGTGQNTPLNTPLTLATQRLQELATKQTGADEEPARRTTESASPINPETSEGQNTPFTLATRRLQDLVAKQTGADKEPARLTTESTPPATPETGGRQNTPLTLAARRLQDLVAKQAGADEEPARLTAEPAPPATPETGGGQNTPLTLAARRLQELAATEASDTKTGTGEGQNTRPIPATVWLPGGTAQDAGTSHAQTGDTGERAGGHFSGTLPRSQELATGAPTPENHTAFSTLTAGLMETDNATAAHATTQLPPLPASLGSPAWEQGMGERVQRMARENIQEAELQINPPELGPVEIKISLQNDQAQVTFLAHHGATREALEAALPKLKEMLGQNHIQLAHAEVSQRDAQTGQQTTRDSQSEHHHSGGHRSGGSYGGPASEETTQTTRPAGLRRLASSLVDDFA